MNDNASARWRRILTHGDVRWLAVLLSLLLSAWLLHAEGVINNDGIRYLRSAEAFARGDPGSATTIYTWPFYSWLIATLHELSGMSLDTSAHVIGAFLCALLVYCFIGVVALFDDRRPTLICAAVLILLWPALNKYRIDVIRDTGYWACYLAALGFFLRFHAKPALTTAIAWGVAIAAGTLFRIEGLVLMAGLPLVLLADGRFPWSARLRKFLTANTVLLACAAGLACYLLLTPGGGQFTGRLAEPLQWLQRLPHNLGEGLERRAQIVEQSLLSQYSAEYAMAVVLAALFIIFAGDVLGNIGLLHLVLAAAAFVGKDRRAVIPFKRVLLWAVILQALVLLFFAVERFFLIGRYILPVTLILVLFAPLGLMRLYESWRARRAQGLPWRKNWLFVVVCLGLVAAFVDSVHSFGPSKGYLKEGGQWLEANAPKDSNVLIENQIAAFYAGRPVHSARQFDSFVRDEKRQIFEYVVYELGRNDAAGAERLRLSFGSSEPVARFANKHGDQLLIFARDKSPRAQR